MSEWDDLSYFLVSILQEAFHQVSDQEKYGLQEDVG